MTTLNIGGILDHSTIDYPERVCAVVYTCGCPFRCPWCQNRNLVLEKNCRNVPIEKIVDELKKNFLISAVCITGGEPLMQNSVLKLVRKLKSETKLKVKVDTNMYFPELLEKVLPHLDFLSVDLKAPLDRSYARVVGLEKLDMKKIGKSLEIIRIWEKPKEARTTIVPGLVDSEKQIENIAKAVKKFNFDFFTLQQFVPQTTLDEKFENLKSPSHAKLLKLGRVAKGILPDAEVRIVTLENGFEEIQL